ncbi:MAG TPA: FAD-dependent oxidoreductase [Burkholderiaceae bacterium]
MKSNVAVMGAGIVGTACALELQRRGYDVTIFDRKTPGRETSYGNAGVIARSSIIPLNNPSLWSALPKLAQNQTAQFRYNPLFVARNLPWAVGFLCNSRAAAFEETATALDALIRLSGKEHLRLLREARAQHRLRTNGWLFLYRSAAGLAGGRFGREIFDRFAVQTQLLGAAELHDLEPALLPIFAHTLWVNDTMSVDSPGAVVEAYAALFRARGGSIVQKEVAHIVRSSAQDRWSVHTDDGGTQTYEHVLLALGPWCKEFLRKSLGVSLPMVFERGYHMHYSAIGSATLQRPVYDTEGGYVLSPMEQGLRLSTGVELADLNAPHNTAQLDMAERAARQAFPLDARLEQDAWMGCRPTLPDCRPAIGACAGQPGLWLAMGHQHIGFSTGPGTAALIGAMIDGEECAIDPMAFRPSRYIH